MIGPDGKAGEGRRIEEARHGSSPAFARLVADHQQAVRAFLRRLCGDWAEADDMAQETFVAAWTHLATFESGRDFRLWLYGIAYRKFLAERRAARRRRSREATVAETLEVSAGVGADERIDLLSALRTLPDDQRAAVALCLAAGVSHSDASELLDMPLGTVKSHVQRGRLALLTALGVTHEL